MSWMVHYIAAFAFGDTYIRIAESHRKVADGSEGFGFAAGD